MSDVMAHRHRRTDVQDVLYDGTEESAREIVAWAQSTGNEAMMHGDRPWVRTQTAMVRVPRDFWVGLGIVGQLWVISNDVHVGCYDPIMPSFGADMRLDDGTLRALRTEAHETTDDGRLREIVDVVVAAALAAQD